MDTVLKEYTEIKGIDSKRIIFHDGSTFYFDQLKNRERDITANPPYFVFRSEYMELRIIFNNSGLFEKKKNERDFHDFQKKLEAIDLKTRDLS